MRNSLRLAALMMGAISTAGVAAADNGWARYTRTLTTGVRGCSDAADRALDRLATDVPQTFRFDRNAAEVHAYVGSEVVFIECVAAPALLCGEPQANMTLLVLSDTTSLSALETLQTVDAQVGDPHRIDCGSAGEGI